MPEAAHQTHLVKHGFAMIGLIAGVVVGAAVAVAVVGTGGGALVLVAAVGTGISAGGGIGQAAGQIMSHFVPGPDTGPIVMGVPTVLIEFFPAAVVTSPVACAGIVVPHPGSVIAQGSGSVFIGGFPAARIGDQLTCGAKVGYGCKSVDIGGGTVSYLEVDSEVPGWVNWGLTAIGMVSGFSLLRMAGVSALGAVARIGGATAGGIGGGMGGGWAAEKAGFAPGSLGHDLASIGGSFLGGAAGFKLGGKAVPGEPIYQNPSGGRGPDGLGNTKGTYSNRPYTPERAGGPIENLSWEDAKISKGGIETVKKHTGRFGEDPANTAMNKRLDAIEKGEIEATDWDKRYYTHEIREYERYQNLGIEDGVDPGYEVWNDTHTATLEDFKLSDYDSNKNRNLYHPEILK